MARRLQSAVPGVLLVLATTLGTAGAWWTGEQVPFDPLDGIQQEACPDYALYATYPQ
jgi:hypothetical protein